MATTDFTPFASLMGGVMIGAAAVLLMLSTGRIAGVSGFVARLLPPYVDDYFAVRLAFVAGLVLAPVAYRLTADTAIVHMLTGNIPLVLAAGLLVGFGSATASGCTSGHGVCGLARGSWRSLAATMTFMAAGVITVFIARHLIGV